MQSLLTQIKTQPETVQFDDVIHTISQNYHYTPTAFSNGIQGDQVQSQAGENEGSCKIFAFAKLNNLTQEQTLHCFGDYYRKDVLSNPDGTDHMNIRTFIKYGWSGIEFEKMPLSSLAT